MAGIDYIRLVTAIAILTLFAIVSANWAANNPPEFRKYQDRMR